MIMSIFNPVKPKKYDFLMEQLIEPLKKII